MKTFYRYAVKKISQITSYEFLQYSFTHTDSPSLQINISNWTDRLKIVFNREAVPSEVMYLRYWWGWCLFCHLWQEWSFQWRWGHRYASSWTSWPLQTPGWYSKSLFFLLLKMAPHQLHLAENNNHDEDETLTSIFVARWDIFFSIISKQITVKENKMLRH